MTNNSTAFTDELHAQWLRKAAVTGDLEGVRFIVHWNPSLLLRADNRGETALHKAAAYGNESVVRYLIQQSPELVYAKNILGETAATSARDSGFSNIATVIAEAEHRTIQAAHENDETFWARRITQLSRAVHQFIR